MRGGLRSRTISAMKKLNTRTRKLVLDKATIKVLSDGNLFEVQGGDLTQSYNSCGDSACPYGEKCRL